MIEFRAADESAAAADALVVGVGEGRRFDDLGASLLDRMPWLTAHLDDVEFTGKAGQIAVVPGGEAVPYRKVALVGLGDAADHEQVRRAAGSAARALHKSSIVATTLHRVVPGGSEAVGCGFGLGAYTYTKHKSEPKPSALSAVILIGGGDDEVAAAAIGGLIADGVNLARDLVNEPAIGKPPAVLAERAVAIAAEVGLTAKVLDEKQIVAERLGGLHGVSLGATNPPRLVELRYEPPGATAFLALVGKGIVFDSGGLSLKPADSMETMKTDMSGAAAVFAAMRTIAALKLPVRVVGIAPITENMPGGAALRPGDVLRARNGKTIEVLNTDAEGRLILADGLSLAAEMKPDLIVDLATLTGAISVALGEKIAGLFGTDGATETVAVAAQAAGERVWRMPLPSDYRKNIDSEVADMKNTGTKYGGAISAALLLKEFVGDVPWAHLDIAGPARSTEAEHYVAKGGTGFGVRTLVELARHMSGSTAPTVG
ncbi:MAG TPA: leucyl aminopeptidase [Acidimicrobiia bacterium]|nr:leucyl aminopeptidase [Acidimicrobiia bacterium]